MRVPRNSSIAQCDPFCGHTLVETAYCRTNDLEISSLSAVLEMTLYVVIVAFDFCVTPCDVHVTLDVYTNSKSKTAIQKKQAIKLKPSTSEGTQMKRTNYMKRAAHRFLEGTKFRTPVEAVEAGLKSLGEWADILQEERELEATNGESRRQNRARPMSRTSLNAAN